MVCCGLFVLSVFVECWLWVAVVWWFVFAVCWLLFVVCCLVCVVRCLMCTDAFCCSLCAL